MDVKWTDESDRELLRRFVLEHSEAAFQGLAERHLSLIYGTAMRGTHHHGAAEEIVQNVLIELVRKSPWLLDRESLASWLHRATWLEARQWWRAESRRKIREATALKLETTMKPSEEASPADANMVDEALIQLGDKDRQAVLLRFFEGRNHKEIGRALGIGEDAARKRIDKALGVMEAYFRRRGHVAGAAAVLSAAAGAHTASVGLAASVVTAALAVHSAKGIGILGTWLGWWVGMSRGRAIWLGMAVLLIPALWQQVRWSAGEAERNRLVTRLGTLNSQAEEFRRRSLEVGRQWQQLSDRLEAARDAQVRSNSQKAVMAALDLRLFRWNETSKTVRLPKELLNRLSFDGKNSEWGVGSYPGEVEKVIGEGGRLSPALLRVLGLSVEEQERLQQYVASAIERYREYADAQARVGGLEMLSSPPPEFVTTNSATRVWMIPVLSENVARWKQQFVSGVEAIIGQERARFLLHQAAQDGSLSSRLEDFGETTPVILVTPLPEGACLLTRSIPQHGRPRWFGNYRLTIASMLGEGAAERGSVETFLRRPLPPGLADYLRSWRQLQATPKEQ